MFNNSKRHIFEENKKDILKMFSSGKTKVDISKKYNVSVPTVREWLRNIEKKAKHRTKDQVIYKEYLPPKGWNLVFNSMRAIT